MKEIRYLFRSVIGPEVCDSRFCDSRPDSQRILLSRAGLNTCVCTYVYVIASEQNVQWNVAVVQEHFLIYWFHPRVFMYVVLIN